MTCGSRGCPGRREFVENVNVPRLSATSPSGTGRDYVIAAVVFAVLMSTALYYNYPQPRTQNANFAWEYGNTAESLALGARVFQSPLTAL